MMINDVGAGTFEEVNRGAAGDNYGWPIIEGPASVAGFTDPIFAYRHSSGVPAGCAITGGVFYNPAQINFPQQYVGKYFFADLCGNWIYFLDPSSPGTVTLFQSGLKGPVNMAVAADGTLYYVQRGNGQVRRIRHTG